MSDMSVCFVKERDTKGAILYKECDDEGKVIETYRDCDIGSIYLRKTSEIGALAPERLVVIVKAA